MFNRTRIAGVVTAVCCAAALCLPAQAAEVDCDSVYCFTGADFQEEVVGICVTDLPDPAAGTVLLGTRVVRAGDILTAEQLSKLTFSPLWTEEDRDAVVTYLPIFENRVDQEATMTIAIHGKQSVVITCDPDNWPSRKTIIGLGCELERIVDVPLSIQRRWEISPVKCRYIWRMSGDEND